MWVLKLKMELHSRARPGQFLLRGGKCAGSYAHLCKVWGQTSKSSIGTVGLDLVLDCILCISSVLPILESKGMICYNIWAPFLSRQLLRSAQIYNPELQSKEESLIFIFLLLKQKAATCWTMTSGFCSSTQALGEKSTARNMAFLLLGSVESSFKAGFISMNKLVGETFLE